MHKVSKVAYATCKYDYFSFAPLYNRWRLCAVNDTKLVNITHQQIDVRSLLSKFLLHHSIPSPFFCFLFYFLYLQFRTFLKCRVLQLSPIGPTSTFFAESKPESLTAKMHTCRLVWPSRNGTIRPDVQDRQDREWSRRKVVQLRLSPEPQLPSYLLKENGPIS